MESWRSLSRRWPLLAVAAALIASLSAAPAQAATTRYVTYMFGRTQIGSYPSGTGCATPIPGDVPLWTAANALKQHGLSATAVVTLNQTRTTELCADTIKYASWQDLQTLRSTYGWSVSSRGRTGKVLTNMTWSQQQDETCGSLSDFSSHGIGDASGMFSYPNNQMTLTIQTSLVNTCYGFGRKYSVGVNKLPIAAPYYARTNSVNGGRCSNTALPCATMTVKSNRQYTSPAALISYENATGWTIIQWYRFVTGKSGSVGSSQPSWDCTSSDWRDHWTNVPEMYCYNDALSVIANLAVGATDTTPSDMAAMQNRTM
jgi:hypothetical protein